MRIALYKNNQFVRFGYCRKDVAIAPSNLAKGSQYYYIDEVIPENTNVNRYYLKPLDIVLTEEIHEEYDHLLKAVKEWELVEYPQESIISKLDDSLGEHLDANYPVWKRTKHLRELETADEERAAYIQSLFDWEDRCRTERDLRETEYLNNNVFPSFEWEELTL